MGFFDFFKADEWVLVKYIDLNVISTNNIGFRVDTKLCFYLYESRSGKRKYKFKHGLDHKSPNFNQLDEFTLKVYPWTKGINFPDIPSYFDKIRYNRKRQVNQLYKLLLKK